MNEMQMAESFRHFSLLAKSCDYYIIVPGYSLSNEIRSVTKTQPALHITIANCVILFWCRDDCFLLCLLSHLTPANIQCYWYLYTQVTGPILVQVDAPVFSGSIAVSVQEHAGTKYLVGWWDKAGFSFTDLTYSYSYAVGEWFFLRMVYFVFHW